MKIYFIDETGKNLLIKKIIEEETNLTLEHKENINFRINKTDIVITTNEKSINNDYKKIQKLIVITKNKDKKEIWNMVEKLNTIDIIYDDSKNYKYIGERIAKLIS